MKFISRARINRLSMAIFTVALLAGCGKPKPPDVDTWTAAAKGDVKALKQHLAAGTNLDANSPSRGGTPLQLAAFYGHTEVARFLVKNGANLEVRDRNGSTPLLVASFFGHPDIVKLLLDSGADVNAQNNNGRTPLDVVAGEWSPELERIYRSVENTAKMQLNYDRLKAARPLIADILREYGGRTGGEDRLRSPATRAQPR